MRLQLIRASLLGWQQRVAGFMGLGKVAIAQVNREQEYSIDQGTTLFGPALDKSPAVMVPDQGTTLSIIGFPDEKVGGDRTNGDPQPLKTSEGESWHLAAVACGFGRFNVPEKADYCIS